ncbi:MAG: metallophosphoesterase [Ignavibacteria bacterium]|nr:metallophosphoesterase [Ignavibacteria bacterium]
MIGIIGDIHGCFYTLQRLVGAIRDKYSEIDLYCVGDLVDRGNFSDKVIQYCMEQSILPVLGNHDCMFMYAFEYPKHPYRETWVANGNIRTLEAYAKNAEVLNSHINFLKKLPLFYNLRDCFISHAGISVLFEEKLHDAHCWDNTEWEVFIADRMHQEVGVLWNRTALMNIGKLQIIGHTKHTQVTAAKRANALYIDTGVYIGNALSCVIINNNEHVDTIAVQTAPRDIMPYIG